MTGTTELVVVPMDGETSPESEIRDVNGTDWVFYVGQPIVELGRKKSIDDMWVHPEPGYTYGRCKMIKRDGDRCRNPVRAGNKVCRHHGAGYIGRRPGGRPVVRGRYSMNLPSRLMDRFHEYLTDPDALSLRSELALVDSRTAEIIERLDTNDSEDAWLKVRQAYAMLKSRRRPDDITDAEGLLEEALESQASDTKIWGEITGLIEQRRRLADTERRRIVDAKQYLSYAEATAMFAFVMDVILTHVKDETVLMKIQEELKRVM